MAFPASLVLFESRCGMSLVESAWLLGMGPLCSGLSQPIFAWVSDRYDSRLFTGLGLAVCAACMCLIGFAQNSFQLLCFYVPAMIAAGSFHPVSAACVGHLSGSHRSLAASGFFVAGMIGGSLGSLVGPRFLSQPFGFRALPYLMIPGVILAIAVHTKVASIPHRSRHARKQITEAGDERLRWNMVWLLFTANALRFTVNMALSVSCCAMDGNQRCRIACRLDEGKSCECRSAAGRHARGLHDRRHGIRRRPVGAAHPIRTREATADRNPDAFCTSNLAVAKSRCALEIFRGDGGGDWFCIDGPCGSGRGPTLVATSYQLGFRPHARRRMVGFTAGSPARPIRASALGSATHVSGNRCGAGLFRPDHDPAEVEPDL